MYGEFPRISAPSEMSSRRHSVPAESADRRFVSSSAIDTCAERYSRSSSSTSSAFRYPSTQSTVRLDYRSFLSLPSLPLLLIVSMPTQPRGPVGSRRQDLVCLSRANDAIANGLGIGQIAEPEFRQPAEDFERVGNAPGNKPIS